MACTKKYGGRVAHLRLQKGMAVQCSLCRSLVTMGVAQDVQPGGRAMSMNPSPHVNYDAIASRYDTQPYRTKTVDPQLLAFLEQRAPLEGLALLDVGCGTGNQLVANRGVVPGAWLVGVDRSVGMLRQAQRKAPEITWVQADGALLPFREQGFDFVTCQYAMHHIHDKAAMLGAVFRVLRPGGRFVLSNI